MSESLEMVFNPTPGTSIEDAAKEVERMATVYKRPVKMVFNEIPIRYVTPGGGALAIVAFYRAESQRRLEAYRKSPECKAAEERRRLEAEKAAADLEAALIGAPETISIKPGLEEEWEAFVKMNSRDGYSSAAVGFATLWARLMEGRLGAGQDISQCSKDMSHLANSRFDITGFMYGCAVSSLSKFWLHGETLRRWHNLETQIGSEGKAANESGGVLNPAMLVVGKT